VALRPFSVPAATAFCWFLMGGLSLRGCVAGSDELACGGQHSWPQVSYWVDFLAPLGGQLNWDVDKMLIPVADDHVVASGHGGVDRVDAQLEAKEG